jgi:hypothetical protein
MTAGRVGLSRAEMCRAPGRVLVPMRLFWRWGLVCSRLTLHGTGARARAYESAPHHEAVAASGGKRGPGALIGRGSKAVGGAMGGAPAG